MIRGSARRPARVRALADEYHYHPNRLATGVFTGKTRTLGCLLPFARDHFSTRILHGVMEAAYAANHEVFVLETQCQLSRTVQAINTMIEHQVDGAIFYTGHLQPVPLSSILAKP